MDQPRVFPDIPYCDLLESPQNQFRTHALWGQAIFERRPVFRFDVGSPVQDSDPPKVFENALCIAQHGLPIIEFVPYIREKDKVAGCAG